MEIRFCGAARTVTGSMHLLFVNGRQVLLDCGLHQGGREEALEENAALPFDPKAVEAVVLSHAHIDHSGNLPALVRQGFRGPIYAHAATRDLCDILLHDSARLQVQDAAYANAKRERQGKPPLKPLYLPEDVDRVMPRFQPVNYERPREIIAGVTITFHDAGHILGSCLTEIVTAENGPARRLLYTGDLGRKGMPILRDPVVVHGAEILITESTYGDRLHPPKADVSTHLARLVNEVSRQAARLIVPAFSVGRTQDLLYLLDQLHGAHEIPDVPVYVVSPMSTRATEVYERHPECYDQETLDHLLHGDSPFSFPRLHFVTEVEESKALNGLRGPMVILSASGMCEGGRILHHLKHGLGDPRNVVLFVGYQAENTLGRDLLEGRNPVRIFGEDFPVAARIERIDALSGHADRNELLEYFRSMNASIARAFVVHGERAQAEALAAALRDLGMREVLVPERGQQVQV